METLVPHHVHPWVYTTLHCHDDPRCLKVPPPHSPPSLISLVPIPCSVLQTVTWSFVSTTSSRVPVIPDSQHTLLSQLPGSSASFSSSFPWEPSPRPCRARATSSLCSPSPGAPPLPRPRALSNRQYRTIPFLHSFTCFYGPSTPGSRPKPLPSPAPPHSHRAAGTLVLQVAAPLTALRVCPGHSPYPHGLLEHLSFLITPSLHSSE